MFFKKILLLVFSLSPFFAFSQNTYLHQLLVLNEGHFDFGSGQITQPVSIGSYNLATGTYTTVVTIDDARFASDIKMDAARFWVAADNRLLCYDADTYALLAETTVPGIRKIALWNDQVLVSRGEYQTSFDAYFQAFDKNTLTMVFEIPVSGGIAHAAEGIEVIGDKAYVAVNNGFEWGAEVGYINEVDMPTQLVTRTMDLGPDGKNPDNLMRDGDLLFTLNNKDFSGSSISTVNISTGTVATQNLPIAQGCGASAYFEKKVAYQEFGSAKIGYFDTETQTTTAETDFGKSFYGMAFDKLNALMYAGETDFETFGKVHIYDATGNPLGGFDTGVAPGNFALDYRSTSANFEPAVTQVSIHPNPATDFLSVQSERPITNYAILNSLGVRVQAQSDVQGISRISVSQLPAGVYNLTLAGNDFDTVVKFVKK